MKTLIIILLISGLVGVAAFGFLSMSHAVSDNNKCMVACFEAMRPLTNAAILAITFLMVVLFEGEFGKLYFDTRSYSLCRGDSLITQFRRRFAYWFSLHEHSPTT